MTYLGIYIAEFIIIVIAFFTLRFLIGSKKSNKKTPKYRVALKSVVERNYRKEQKLRRELTLTGKVGTYKDYNKYAELLTAFGLTEQGVTVTGFKFGLRILYVCLSLVFILLLDLGLLTIIFVYPVMAKLVFTLVRMRASSYKDRRERAIMDAIDIIVSDIDAGIEVAIRQYIDVFDKSIRNELLTFINNIDHNMSFRDAMTILNNSLGSTFTDFAEKAKVYEIEEREGTKEMFTETVEINSIKRDLKFKQDSKFAEFKLTFYISVCLVGGFFLMSVLAQPFVQWFYFQSLFGKILLLIDILIITFVISYLDIIKSKEL